MTRLQHLHDAGELYHIPFFDWRRTRQTMRVVQSLPRNYYNEYTFGVRAEFLSCLLTRFPVAPASSVTLGSGASVAAGSIPFPSSVHSAAGVADMDVDAEIPVRAPAAQRPVVAGMLEPAALLIQS